MGKKMNFNNLRNFVLIAKEGNITRAAEKNFISQPALSIHLKELEKELNVQLFSRKNRKLTLTEEGQILYDWAEPFISSEKDVLDQMHSIRKEKTNVLNIGIMGVDFLYRLPFLSEEFKKNDPNVDIQIQRMTWNRLTSALKKGTIDISFQILTSTVPKNCDYITLEEGHECVVLPKSNPLSKKKAIRPEELKNQNFVIMNRTEESDAFLGITNICQSAGFTPNIIAEFDYSEPMFSMISMGDAITISSTLAPVSYYNNITLVDLYEPEKMRLCAVWLKNTKNKSVLQFIEFLKSNT